MDYLKAIRAFKPANEQERNDQRIILQYAEQFPHNILLRDNEVAHLTSSGMIFNRELSKVLMVHHNILNTWAWTGGHADGDSDLLGVALREAQEETGIRTVEPLTGDIASLDILWVPGHVKRGKYVSVHLHLSVAFLLAADEAEGLRIKSDENSGVAWIPVEEISEERFDPADVYLYGKLIERARAAVRDVR